VIVGICPLPRKIIPSFAKDDFKGQMIVVVGWTIVAMVLDRNGPRIVVAECNLIRNSQNSEGNLGLASVKLRRISVGMTR
jgi:hypothetical protein